MTTETRTAGTTAAIQAAVARVLGVQVAAPLDLMIRRAPWITTVRQLAAELETKPQTLTTQFARAGVPSPKQYLAFLRLIYAAGLLHEDPPPPAAHVAEVLHYSSAQSFGRHLRNFAGDTATQFRARHTEASMLKRFETSYLRRFRHGLRALFLTEIGR